MKIKVTDVSRCTGGAHAIFDVLVNDTISKRYAEEIDKMKDYVNSLSDRDIALTLMYCEIKKAGATTPTQIKTALLNKEWEW